MPSRAGYRWDAETPIEESMTALDDALAALDLSLDAEEVARLEAPYTPRSPSGYAW
ncbi:hypothetical protein ABZ297_12050 [Nonomuraea sp. NPDC005983]|uniref:hypothetical protein n=1 Tax=Nonomuraea sp. NPDC005983 TaxID=3155595 RepID=UPI0033A2B9E0